MFKRMLLGVASLVMCAGVAKADVQVVSHVGDWQNIEGRASDGKYMCGIMNDGGIRHFMVKWFDGVDKVAIQIFKNDWNIPAHTIVDLKIQFDGDVPWNAHAVALSQNPNGMEIPLVGDQIRHFLGELRNSSSVTITFATGSEGPWIGSMAGSGAAVLRMSECVTAFTRTHVPTQPFDAPAPASTSAPQASQPYVPPSQPIPLYHSNT